MQTMKMPVIENNDFGIDRQQNIQSNAVHRVIDMIWREGVGVRLGGRKLHD
jgi:hypothetical protein